MECGRLLVAVGGVSHFPNDDLMTRTDDKDGHSLVDVSVGLSLRVFVVVFLCDFVNVILGTWSCPISSNVFVYVFLVWLESLFYPCLYQALLFNVVFKFYY